MGSAVGPSAARLSAIRALAAVRTRDAYVAPVIEAEVARAGLAGADRAMAVTLALGVVETLGVLDEVIDRYAARKVEPRVRDALRVAVYELLYMKTPARAAVHQGVEAVRTLRPQAASMANAILRRVAETADDFPWGDPAADLGAAARAAGYPEWIANRAVEVLGGDAGAEMLASARTPAPLYVRVNPFVSDLAGAIDMLAEDGTGVVPSPPDSWALRVTDDRAAVTGRAVREGAVVVTDAAAQVAPIAVGARPGGTIVDVGAGRGTKTVALQGMSVQAGAPARIVSVDTHEYKVRILAERMRDLGVPGVETVVSDIQSLPQTVVPPASADAVLLDAPCSGTGTLRRHPEIIWRLEPSQIARFAALQLELLIASARLVRPGGVLVYSTCSVMDAENGDVVRAFLGQESGREFAIDPLGTAVPEVWRRFITPEGHFRSWPTIDGPDGHFVARLIRTAPLI